MAKKVSGCSSSNGKNGSCSCQERFFDEFLEDVEKDLKIERYQEFWNKHGKLLSTVGTVCLAAVTFVVLWQRYEVGQRTEAAGELVRAQVATQSGKLNEALGIVQFLSQKHLKTYPVLAKFEQAALLAQTDFDKKVDSILALYKELMDSSIPGYMRELASILYVRALMRRAKQQALEPAQAKSALQILKKYRQKPAKGHSVDGLNLLGQELQGQLYFQCGDLKKARKMFDSLSKNSKTPEMMNMRTRLMIQLLQERVGTDADLSRKERDEPVSTSSSSVG